MSIDDYEERLARSKRIREDADQLSRNLKKHEYFSLDDAVNDVKLANGAGETTFASVKLVSKTLANLGKFTFGEALPVLMKNLADNDEALTKKMQKREAEKQN